MKRSALLIIILGMFFCAATAFAAENKLPKGDAILGVWLTEGKEARIEIFRCADRYCGKIAWTIDPVYTPAEDSERAGKPKTDDNNPNPALRMRPIVGLQIMSGLHYIGDNRWVKGSIYDPGSGHTYGCQLSLLSPHELEMRGYFIVPLLGGKTVWKRVK
jgi:uncharacterized protein (DUF2147 family)